MASQVQDQNLHYTDAANLKKTNASKAVRKGGGGLTGRKPLGDLSNSLKSPFDQMTKKQNSELTTITQKKTSASRNVLDAGKKVTSKASSAKLQSGSRKALSDISNSGKPQVREAASKNLSTNLSVLAEESVSYPPIEPFEHNHQECIKQRTRAMKLDEFLRIVGLDEDFVKEPASPRQYPMPDQLQKVMDAEYLLIEEPSLVYKPTTTKFESSPPLSPISPASHRTQWGDTCVNFKLIDSP